MSQCTASEEDKFFLQRNFLMEISDCNIFFLFRARACMSIRVKIHIKIKRIYKYFFAMHMS